MGRGLGAPYHGNHMLVFMKLYIAARSFDIPLNRIIRSYTFSCMVESPNNTMYFPRRCSKA